MAHGEEKSEERTRWLRPDDEARRIDELIREAEEAIRNTKRFLDGIQGSNPGAREHIVQIKDRFERDLRGLRRRQEQEDSI